MDARVRGSGSARSRRSTRCRARSRRRSTRGWCPTSCFDRFGIDPATLCDRDGARLVRVTAPADKPWARVEVRSSAEDRDPALLVDVEMSPLSVPELAFVQITDPAGRALRDRPRPGRARHALRHRVAQRGGGGAARCRTASPPARCGGACGCSRGCSTRWRASARLIGKEIYLIEPLFYHSAILYERRGCGYLMGRDVMEEIHAGFSRGRVAAHGARRLLADFRAPEAARTVRGRSWALHDGVARGSGPAGRGRGEDVQGGRPSRGRGHVPGRALLTSKGPSGPPSRTSVSRLSRSAREARDELRPLVEQRQDLVAALGRQAQDGAVDAGRPPTCRACARRARRRRRRW